MRFLFGGSAVIATALLASSLFIYPQLLLAETNPSQDPAQQQKKATLPLSQTELASVPEPTLAALPTNLPADKSINVDLGSAPPALPANAKPVKTQITYDFPSQSYVATAYCLRGRTASGRYVAKGIIAADRSILPLGTRVRISAGAYSGEYLVADTGGVVRGRKIDVWMPSSGEALRFGRRKVKLTVLSYGRRRGRSAQY